MRPLPLIRLLAQPWQYDQAQPLANLRASLSALTQQPETLLTSNGRSALLAIFRGLDATPGDEVIMQAFTCVAAVNPIVWANLTPVFADIDRKNLGMSLGSLANLISDRTRAVVVQHTFGIPADVATLAKLAREHHLTVIEDCAHALGVQGPLGPLGCHGDLAMLSFGIQKQLSSRTGGAIQGHTGSSWHSVWRSWDAFPALSKAETARWLGLPFLEVLLRRAPESTSSRLRPALVRMGALRQAITEPELTGGYPPATPAKLNGSLAAVILSELEGLQKLQRYRARMVGLYKEQLDGVDGLEWPIAADGPLLWFPLLARDRAQRDHLRATLSASGYAAATWYDPPVFPAGVDLARLGYKSGHVPVAEETASRILCLPTGRNITEPQLYRLVDLIRNT